MTDAIFSSFSALHRPLLLQFPVCNDIPLSPAWQPAAYNRAMARLVPYPTVIGIYSTIRTAASNTTVPGGCLTTQLLMYNIYEKWGRLPDTGPQSDIYRVYIYSSIDINRNISNGAALRTIRNHRNHT